MITFCSSFLGITFVLLSHFPHSSLHSGNLVALNRVTGDITKTWKVAKDNADDEAEEDENLDYVVPKAHLGELGAIAIDKQCRYIVWGWNRFVVDLPKIRKTKNV